MGAQPSYSDKPDIEPEVQLLGKMVAQGLAEQGLAWLDSSAARDIADAVGIEVDAIRLHAKRLLEKTGDPLGREGKRGQCGKAGSFDRQQYHKEYHQKWRQRRAQS